MPGELKKNVVSDFNCSLKLNSESDKNITKMSGEKVVSDCIQVIEICAMENVESQNHNFNNVEEAAEIVTLSANVKEKLSVIDIGDAQGISPENMKSDTTGEKIVRVSEINADNIAGTSNTEIANVIAECSPQLNLDCNKMSSNATVNKHSNNLSSDSVIDFDDDIENATQEENDAISKSVSDITLQEEQLDQCQKVVLLEKPPDVIRFKGSSETSKGIGGKKTDMMMTGNESNVSRSTRNYSNHNIFNEVITEMEYVGKNQAGQSMLIHIQGRI